VGEKLMGIPGMVLAPVALHFIRVEASAIRTLPSDHPGIPSRADHSE